MADATGTTPTPQNRQPRLVEMIAQHPREVSLALYAAGLLLALVPLYLGIRFHAEYLWVCIWGALLALLAWTVALWQTLRTPGSDDLDNARMVVIVLGGMAGLFTTLMGFMLGVEWWDTFVSWVRGEPENIGRIIVALLAIVGGLGIMFASLQAGRSQERSNPSLRVLMYGYNATLSGMLLLAILVVANVLTYLKLPAYADFTSASLYTLSERSKHILAGLEKPTKIYAVFSSNSFIGSEVKSLLSRCREVNDKLQLEYLSPDRDAEKVRDLVRRFGVLDREGVLITYGTDAQMETRFIKEDDLSEMDNQMMRPNPDEKKNFKFKGEDALMTQLDFLEQGLKKAVVYFTQGSGELDLNRSEVSRIDVGAGVLKSKLEKRNLTVQPLTFSPTQTKVPDDAELVVIAGPKNPMPDFALKALSEYANPTDPKKPKGKLFVLLDVVTTRDNKMVQTGLEGLLAQFDVQVPNEQIMSLPTIRDIRHPIFVLAAVNQSLVDRNPIAGAFAEEPFVFYSARPIRPRPEPPGQPGGGRYTVDVLFETMPSLVPVWTETDFRRDPIQTIKDFQKDPKELQDKLARTPIPMAVVVSESAPPDPTDPHAMMRPREGKPRLVVFGDASLASNPYVSQGPYFDLVASCVDWLRNRPNSIGIAPKERNFFALGPNVSSTRMIVLPGLIAALAIIGLGTGVWIVRRR